MRFIRVVLGMALVIVVSMNLLGAAPAPAPAGKSAPGAKPAPQSTAPKPAAKPASQPVRLSGTANGMGLRFKFAVKDLTPAQKDKSIPILQAFDAEYGPIERAREDERLGTLRRARETGTTTELDAWDQRGGQWSRRMYKLENAYEDRLGAEVLTPKQRAAWDAYRIYFAAAFHLAFTGLEKEDLKKLEPLSAEVVRDVTEPKNDGWALFQKRLMELKERAAEKLMTDEQRVKYGELKAKRAEHEQKVDALEANPATATKLPPPRAAKGTNDGFD